MGAGRLDRRRFLEAGAGGLVGVAASGPMRTRTVAVLPRELVAGDRPARIGARTGLLAEGEGFSGFLVGAGGGAPDHRAAALVQGVSGEGGGILCGGLPNPGSTPHTGDFTDAYGNGMRVLAVANPKLTKAAFRAARRGRNAELGDRDRKREGYGLVRVAERRRRFVIECWPWDGGPQFDGWPYELPFPEV